MEVERDVVLEYGGDSEAGASTGSRTAGTMPRFTEDELKVGLGEKVNRQIEEIFEDLETPPKAHGKANQSTEEPTASDESRGS